MRASRLVNKLIGLSLTVLLLCMLTSVAMAQVDSGSTDTAQPDTETATAEPAPDGLETGSQAHDIRLRQLEEKVNHLKEKIFRSKARLMLLQETILHGVIAGSKAVITHKNDMGGAYKLESVAYYLDGAPIFGKINLDGTLDSDEELTIYDGTIQPGNHLLSVYMVYRGKSPVFVYVEGIQVKLKTSHNFKAEEGKVTKVSVVGYDKGGVIEKFDDRPAVRYETSFTDLQDEDLKKTKDKNEQN